MPLSEPTVSPAVTSGPIIYTIGHSTHPLRVFVDLLDRHSVTFVVDVRTVPRSRHNPQFNRDTLPGELAASRIGYEHMKALGGLRKQRADSLNAAWRNTSFRGFADYMDTPEFAHGLERLIELSHTRSTAVMCAESLPWRCHRSLIADALSARSLRVVHIMPDDTAKPHSLTAFAKVKEGRVSYPAP